MNWIKRISLQEVVLGALSTAIFLNIWLCLDTAILWCLGGTLKKSIRRFGVPIAVACVSYFLLHAPLWYLSLMGIGVLSLGDGFRSTQPPDEGSWLGRQVERVIKDEYWGGLITKVIPVLLLQAIWLTILLS